MGLCSGCVPASEQQRSALLHNKLASCRLLPLAGGESKAGLLESAPNFNSQSLLSSQER